jgi:DNA-binding transcriptional ArsR family regulator
MYTNIEEERMITAPVLSIRKLIAGSIAIRQVKIASEAKLLLTPPHDLCILYYMVNDSSEQLTTVFMALADPTRRAILERLKHGEASGTELARPFSISVPAISKHLRVLKNADLILHRKDGRTHMFRLAARPMRDAAVWLEQYRHFWEAQFDSLETYLQATSEEEQDIDDPSSIS